jgi:hypothetical protein
MEKGQASCTKQISLQLAIPVVVLLGWLILGAVNQSLVVAQSGDDAAAFPAIFMRDVVVSNTDQTLKNTDMFLNAEPSIAVNPRDPRKVVISAFSGAWSNPNTPNTLMNAPIWYTTNGGALWKKEFTITPPPGVPSAPVMESPCDQTFDYGRDGALYGTFLLNGLGEEGGNCSSVSSVAPTGVSSSELLFAAVYTGATTNPADSQAWKWLVVNGTTQPTNRFSPDQPWLVVNIDPLTRRRENVYVAYQASPSMQVAVAQAAVPPNFTIDNTSANNVNVFGANAGHRAAADHHSGVVYSLYQQGASIECAGQQVPINYMLNRSVDGGMTWGLNGQPGGIVAAQACSNQKRMLYAFGEPEPGVLVGGVNALQGGVDALAVDPNTGDVYVVYGNFDQSAGRDRISIVRITGNGQNGVTVGKSYFVSGTQHQSALPAVAVAEGDDGAVGVLYDTADGLDPETGSRPFFSVHLAISRNHGQTFQDTVMQTFLFPKNAPNSSLGGPRPLGDYQQLKALGETFYGVYSGDGQPFGRPFQKIDPIFFKTSIRKKGD